MPSTTAIVAEGVDEQQRVIPRRKLLYAVTFGVLWVMLGLAVLDGADVIDVYGVDDAVVRDGPLTVVYPTVARPALALPFHATVTRPGGFDGPITLAIDRDWVQLGDLNGVHPAPSAETSDEQWLEWEFDPPAGDTLDVSIDFRVEPALQQGRDGAMQLREGDETVAAVRWHTRVLP